MSDFEKQRNGAGSADWSRLLALHSVESATREIRRMLDGPGDAGVRSQDASEADPVAEALAVWSAARTELTRMEQRLEARTRELGLLQNLGRKAAEAHTVSDLFRIAAETLQERLEIELVLTVRLDVGPPRVDCYQVRPVEQPVLREIATESCSFIESSLPQDVSVGIHRLASWDEKHWPMRSVREQDMVMLPIRRRDETVACLTLVHSSPPGEARFRLLYGAANQLSTHMDRILTVQEAEQGRFRSILECMPQAVILADTGFLPVRVNPAGHELLERLGFAGGPRSVRHLDGLDLGAMADRVLKAGGPAADSEARLPDGRTFNVTASAVRGERGRIEGWVFVFTDLTESRRMQDQLSQAEKMSSLGQMISGVAHELNNPLASILGYAQLLQATTAGEGSELSGRLKIMDQEARRCQKIVQNLLSFARRRDPERKPYSLNELVQSVIALMRYQLRMDNIEIESATDPELPYLNGDAHQLQQALLNLVTNAHQAMKQGRGGKLTIRTGLAGADLAELVVEDDGPGIPAANRNRIFDPFFTTKAPGEGTGLGLSLVYGAVTAHGGTVECRASPAGGARFVVHLPLGHKQDDTTAAEEGPAGEVPPVGRSSILVVDDELPVARLLAEMLGSEGHEVDVATDGNQALELLSEGQYDLVVTDYRMPGLGGKPLCDAIARDFATLKDRVIMTTGDTVSGEPERAASEAGVPLIHKPFDLDDFRSLVRRRLHREESGTA